MGERAWTVAEALRVVGGLSRTTKMPCHSWGIPAHHCKTGTRLAKLEGTVCSHCYALKHAYAWRTVQRAYERRLAQAGHPDWEEAMTVLVEWQARRNREAYFRWFDSGDLQSPRMLEQIVTVARATPSVRHWLPTREYAFLRGYLKKERFPENLIVRASAARPDHAPPALDVPTSTVHARGPPQGYVCPAYQTKPATCGTCRACWDPTVKNISYPLH